MRLFTDRLNGTVAVPALACALALLAIAAYVTAASAHDHASHGHGAAAGEPAVHATWVDRPTSVDAATKGSLFVVEARVTGIRTGTTMSSVEDIGGGLTETDTTPTQLIDFSTVSVVKGPAPSSFTIHKTGSSSWYIEGDPPYRTGERHLLFVERFVDENGAVSGYINLAPDGRLFVDANNILHAFIDGALAIELDGRPLETAKQKVTLAMIKDGIVPTTTTTSADPGLGVNAPTIQDTAADTAHDADDNVSGAVTTGVQTTDAAGPLPSSPVTDDPCPSNLPTYCPAP